MTIFVWITIIFFIEMIGKISTLLFLMRHATVKSGNYRTWVLLGVFIPFAWLAYWCFGFKK